MALLGIDFGTSLTRAARWVGTGDPEARVISVPSVALPQESGFLVGELCWERHRQSGAVPLQGLKRILERAPNDLVARVVAARCGATLHVPNDRLVLRTSTSDSVAVDACVAALLHQATAGALEGETEGPRHAVLTVPEWFGSSQQAALSEAARHAGIRVLRYLGEGTAVALWLARSDPSERTLAVVNVGAGGTSATIASIDAQGVYLSAATSDRHWGGDDVTAALVESQVRALPPADAERPELRELARQAVEELKPELARRGTATRVLPASAVHPQPWRLELGAPELADALEGVLGALDELCADVLDQADSDADDVDEVLLVGGLSELAAVREAVARGFGQAPRVERRFEQFTVLGAAYEAAILADEADGPLVLDGRSTGRLNVVDRPH